MTAAAQTGRGEPLRQAPGRSDRSELRCGGCGYGIVVDVRRQLPGCPMCGSLHWLAVERSSTPPAAAR